VLGAKQDSVPNRLLAALPRNDYQRLLPFLEPVKLSFKEVLYEPHTGIPHVYFPNDCLVSMLTTVNSGRAAEVGLIGSEGMLGIPVALGIASSPFRAVVQGGGTAMRMKVADFRREFGKSDALRRELFLFTHMLMIQIAQTAACNRFHVVQKRMARWLLMTRDRVNSNEFRITQEFLGLMLGVRRSGITVAASSLQDRKLIGYRRGTVTILDQRGLEAAACECYKTVKDTYTQATPRHKLRRQFPREPRNVSDPL
jgi:CRP-like cAMP-binding protein